MSEQLQFCFKSSKAVHVKCLTEMENVSINVEPFEELECHYTDDIRLPIKITEFKQELNPSDSTESGFVNLSQSTFKTSTSISDSDTGEIDSKDNSFSQVCLTNYTTKEHFLPEYRSDDLKPITIITEFKQELYPFAVTESDTDTNIPSQSTFKLTDTNEINSKHSDFSQISLPKDGTQEFFPQEYHGDDVKILVPSIITNFKQELDPNVPTGCDNVSFSLSTFKLSTSGSGSVDSKEISIFQTPLCKGDRDHGSLYHSKSEQDFSSIKEEFGKDSIRKSSPLLLCSSSGDHPIVIQSKVDDLVSENVDLENDIAGEPIQKYEHLSKELIRNTSECNIGEEGRLREDSSMKDKGKIKSGEEQILEIKSGKLVPKVMIRRIHCTSDVNYETTYYGHLKNEVRIKSSHLQRHMEIHTGEKQFKCQVCAKCFNRKDCFKNHMKIHTRGKQFKCQVCEKYFNRKDGLINHMRIHTGEKSFKCGECKKCFYRNCNLQNHMRTHTGEKPFKCEECEKCFSRKEDLKMHMRIHTGEKSFKCGECEKCFYRNSNLQNHMRMHTGDKPFKCKECEKCYTCSSHLKRHIMRIHTGEKSFKCKECEMCYTCSSHLKRHIMIIHKGEKPFM